MTDSPEDHVPGRNAAARSALARTGRPKHGFVNPAVVRGSTVTFETLAEFENALSFDLQNGPYSYGLLDTPTERSPWQDRSRSLDGADGGILVESGLAAVGVALLAFVARG